LKQCFEGRQAAGLAMPFFSLFRSAKPDQSLSASFLRGHAAPEILLDRQVDVRCHFGVKLVVHLIAPEKSERSLKRFS
jgi:hypothetical protein